MQLWIALEEGNKDESYFVGAHMCDRHVRIVLCTLLQASRSRFETVKFMTSIEGWEKGVKGKFV